MTEWLIFAVGVLLSLTILYLPGFLALRTFLVPSAVSLALAAPISIALEGVLFILYAMASVRVTPLSFCLPLLVVLGVACAMTNGIYAHRSREQKEPGALQVSRSHTHSVHAVLSSLDMKSGIRGEWLWALGAFVASVAITVYLYVKPLDGPNSYTQLYDNAWHLGIVRRFMQTGDYSTLHSGSLVPTLGSRFYPTGWHGVVALVSAILGCSPALAANAFNTAILGVVIPASMFVLLRWIFRGHNQLWIAGLPLTLLFSAFPWRFTVFGPLWSNLLSFAMLPVLIAEAVFILDARTAWHLRGKMIAIFVVSFVGIAFAQPNAVFSLAIVCAVFLLFQVPGYIRAAGVSDAKKIRGRSAIIDVILVLVMCIVWIVLYRLPMMSRTVHWKWSKEVSLSRAIFRALCVSYGSYPQLILAALVLVGFLYTCVHRNWLWISISALIFQFIYVLCDGTEGPLKQILGGFWYHDYNRLAASAVILQIPLAGLGLWVLVQAVWWAIGRVSAPAARKTAVRVVSAVMAWAVVAVLTLLPSMPGEGTDTTQLAFGQVRFSLEWNNKRDNPLAYSEQERHFVQKAEKIAGRNAVLLNFPYDGSIFAYAEDGTNVYFKAMGGNWMGRESHDMHVISRGLSHIGTDPAVQKAVRRIGAQYVLLLDRHELVPDPSKPGWDTSMFTTYERTQWRGYAHITSKTPGLKLVLREGDNRLYRIVR